MNYEIKSQTGKLFENKPGCIYRYKAENYKDKWWQDTNSYGISENSVGVSSISVVFHTLNMTCCILISWQNWTQLTKSAMRVSGSYFANIRSSHAQRLYN